MELGFCSVIRIVRYRMMIVLLFVLLVCYAECGGGNSGISYGKDQVFLDRVIQNDGKKLEAVQ